MRLITKRRLKTLHPFLALSVLGALLTACSTTPSVTEQQSSEGTRTSSDAMIDDHQMSSAPMYDGMSSSEAAMASSESAMLESSVYKDGTYAAKGNYNSPAGLETVDVSLTLKDDTVTNATVSGEATNPKSKVMQGNFVDGFKEFVVGKSLDDVAVDVVNGSSLTGKGFMDAVAKIKAQAKS